MPSDYPVQRAAGGVVWRRHRKRTEVLLVHRPIRADWSLPKGKAKPGENPLQTAMREVAEETGLPVTMGAFLTQVRYSSGGADKRVDYWAMRLDRDSDGLPDPTDLDEVDGAIWLPVGKARDRLTYANDHEVIDRFADFGEVNVRMLLVRHGTAGDKASWRGDDDLRPLDAKGRAQATAIAATLAAFAPARVISARPLRCEQTVAPLAHRLGLRVEQADELSEPDYADHPERTMKTLGGLLSVDGPVVVCSQGGVIPKAVADLKPARLRRIPKTRKGSVWVIGVLKKKTETADYYADLSRGS